MPTFLFYRRSNGSHLCKCYYVISVFINKRKSFEDFFLDKNALLSRYLYLYSCNVLILSVLGGGNRGFIMSIYVNFRTNIIFLSTNGSHLLTNNFNNP